MNIKEYLKQNLKLNIKEGYDNVSILMDKTVRLDRYGKGCKVCNSQDCTGTDCHINEQVL